jgi:hypothetical protein
MNKSDSILYFPTIEIQDPNWLKASLLIWGKIYRIVPPNYEPNDSDDVNRAIDAGLLDGLKLSADELAETYDSYTAFLEGQVFIPDGLDDHGSYDQLHVDKIDARLYPILEKVAKEINNGFLKIPSHLARGYMLYLATNAARRRGINVATNSADAWVTSSYFCENGEFSDFVYPSSDTNLLTYSNIGIRDLIPIDLDSVSINDAIKFAEKYSDEKENFRSVVVDFLNELQSCMEGDHAAHIVDKYGKSLATAKADFQASSSFLSKGTIRSSLVIGVPVFYTVLGAMTDLLGKENYIHLSSSLLIGFVAAMAERNFTSDAHKNSVGNFLVNMDKELARSGQQPDYSYLFDQFIND